MTKEVILQKLMKNKDYFVEVFPYLQESDFEGDSSQIYKAITSTYNKYKSHPTFDELQMYFEISSEIPLLKKPTIHAKMAEIKEVDYQIDYEKLVDYTEKYIRDTRYDQAIEKAIEVREGSNQKITIDDVQKMMEEALKTSFKSTGGHDYVRDASKRFEEYGKREEDGISTGIEIIDIAAGGSGLLRRSLLIPIASSNSGKTMLCSHIAVQAATQGKNVAIFSFEDGEIAYSSRIDANIMNVTLDEMKLKGMALNTHFESVIRPGFGTIKVKEYPPRGASSKHIRAQLDEWAIKDSFKPDLIIIDAINIALPSTTADGMYSSGKYVAEDFRAIAVDYDVPVVAPSQAGRQSFGAKEMGMEDVAESVGIVQTADTCVSFILDPNRPDIRIMSILKSRSVDRQKFKPTVVNCSTEYQRLWDLSENERRYIKKENKEVLHHMDEIVEMAESLKQSGDSSDDLLANIMSQKF